MKNKVTAALLAFFLGTIGTHRFYLGQPVLGFAYFIFAILAMAITVAEGVPIIAIAGTVAFMDAVLFAVMPKAQFDKQYNKKFARESLQTRKAPKKTEYVRSERVPQSRQEKDFHYLKRKGIEAYRDQYLEDAIAYFNDALDLQPEDPAIHFNLACCHSRLEESIDAFFHLEKAVEYGFDDMKKIHDHKALAYLRTLEDFELFVENGYQSKPLDLPDLEKEDDLLEQLNQTKSQELLDKLKQLSELRNKGILTEEEFAEQKRRLLNE